ncbi:carbohydrate esterase family 4 protein [Plenodomus tracheiphilus IPT5]|uniref:Carbohydrate esterase family 4 protein n=1 Tax=Plenodomus tracheiphilus IPT5 TaxID=1408161 RepID=A0A6A7BIM0_9PLEO|nr:carbohydrate esterase family 4 protein [Plenodomus tracheiphilus IPT5]
MRFSDVFTASLVVPLIAAHGDHHFHAAPKIIGLPRSDIGGLKNRNILGGHEARVVRPHQDSKLTARQVGGNADGRCGKDFGCATCNTGYCCSVAGYCGTGPDFCQSPDCNFEYGPACDANKVPTGGSTRNTPRTKLGSQTYGGEGIYSCVNPGEVAITYDDGPYTYTDELLNLLATKGAKATFFVTGINLSKGAIDTTSAWSNVIKRMVSEKHQVASHTWSHQDLSAITSAQRYDQMVRNEMALSNILGKFPTYMRPPYSSCTAASGCQKDLADLGYVVSYFDLDTDDYNQLTTTKIQVAKDNVVKGFAGTNPANDNRQLIAHDIHQLTAQDLSTYMVNYIDSLGYKMVTLGQCMGEPEANWYRTPSARTASTSSFAAPTACSSGASSSRVSTSAAATSTPSGVSTDGMCGSTAGKTCLNSGLGECCSQYGWCGATTDHCGTGCQAGFGQCGSLSSSSTLLSTGTARSSSAVVSSTVRSSTVGASSTKASSSASSTKAASSVSSTKASSTAGVSSTRAASSAAASASTVAKVSTDGTCGGTNGYTCAGFSEGECCSSYGWCGSSTGHHLVRNWLQPSLR